MVQKSGRVETPAIFALGFYITLPLTYILVAKLLKNFSLKNISLAGLTGSLRSFSSSTTPLIIDWLIALIPSWGWDKISAYRLLALAGK